MQYLQSLAPPVQQSAAHGLFASAIACVVVTAGIEPLPIMVALAEDHGVALFKTPLTSGVFINRVHAFLDEQLSPTVLLHGVLVDVFSVGILLSGPSGIGKSECALDLILRGHRLVADDAVLVRRKEAALMGSGSPRIRHHMEIRGLGIINVKDLFGAASVCERKPIDLVVEMMDWSREKECDRLGVDEHYEPILGQPVPKVRLPIQPGRNVAAIVEVAARNQLLKKQGHHAARDFMEKFDSGLAPGTPPVRPPEDV
jgi:HPr kinase/phosphorylase